MLFDNQVQVMVSKVDRENDRVWIVYQNPHDGKMIEREMSLKELVRIINLDPNSKIQQPVVN